MRVNFKLACLFLACVLCLSVATHGQVVKVDSTSRWKKSFKSGLNLNQSSFSSNWKAGGVNSIGFTALLNYKANYKNGKKSWDSEFDFLYGMINNTGQGYRKTLDRIFIDTKYGDALNTKWDLIASANLQSQFANGYKYGTDANGLTTQTLISSAFAPTYITVAIGFEYHPVPYFKLRLSPLAPRITILDNAQQFVVPLGSPTPYGVDPKGNTRFQWYAFQLFAEFDKDIATNINLKWRYVMFADYELLSLDKINHRVDLNITAKVNKFINMNLGTIVIYNTDQDLGVQISQAFSLGVLYTFQNFKDK